jgi:hypothetical protein
MDRQEVSGIDFWGHSLKLLAFLEGTKSQARLKII